MPIGGNQSVWAYRNEGTFGFQWGDNLYGYDQLLMFPDLGNLMTQMDSEDLKGKVWRLSIVAHGNQAGVVQLEETLSLSVATLGQFHGKFHRLRNYLTRDATLMFVSCIAGAGREGDALLKAVSVMLPTRYVVGFTQYGLLIATGLNAPGAVYSQGSPFQAGELSGAQHERLDVGSRFAKIARNGEIIHQAEEL